MPIYRMNEGATAAEVADSVQNPENPMPDLKDIEEKIMDSHDEEVEDAVGGLIDDSPVAECFMSIYESEYNYNQLLEAVGTFKLNEMANGREPIMEAADFKEFLERAKQFFIAAAKKIAEIFMKAVRAIINVFNANKKLASKYGKQIEDGYSKLGDNAPKGYAYNFDILNDNALNSARPWNIAKFNHYRTQVDRKDYSIDKNAEQEILKNACGKAHNNSVHDISTMRTAINKYVCAGRTEEKPTPVNLTTVYTSASKVIDALNNDLVKNLKDEYNTVKKKNDEYIDGINELEKSTKKSSYSGDDKEGKKSFNDEKKSTLNDANNFIKIIKFEQSALHARLTVLMSHAHAYNNQTRKMAMACVSAAGVKLSAEEAGQKPENIGESASLFAGFKML